MLNDKEVESTVENAFKPLRCVAEVWDYGAKLRFRVYSPSGEAILKMDSALERDFRDRARLAKILDDTRMLIVEKGFTLEPLANS